MNIVLGPIALAVFAFFGGLNFAQRTWGLFVLDMGLVLWLAWKLEQNRRTDENFKITYTWSCFCGGFTAEAPDEDKLDVLKEQHRKRYHSS